MQYTPANIREAIVTAIPQSQDISWEALVRATSNPAVQTLRFFIHSKVSPQNYLQSDFTRITDEPEYG